MSIKKIKSLLKPIVLQLAPKYYYKRLVRQGKKAMSVNTLKIHPTLFVAYNPTGKYPTMYEKPQSYYENQKKRIKFDKNGIPMLNINDYYVYHPVYLIQHALSEYGFFVFNNDNNHFEKAKRIANWLVENQHPDTGCWYYTYDYKHELTDCMLKAPWASAMAQGQGISLLTRIYHVTNDQKYLDASIKATTLLDVPISSGGLASELWGHTVFEEYPTIPNSYTLNGFMFCALGLYDLTKVSDNKRIEELWEIAKQTLEFMIPLYDGDIMSVYCLSFVTVGNIKRHLADKYHPLHITLLQCFESFMPNPTFEFYIRRWSRFFGIELEE